ncbi:MAG: sigma-54-dependent Fis family transcriptional regulator [Anaerolineaceae bacterium]|nr:sigma-54-dependent Fis family transcriptional regulator [Anaerolineaceae bacterium]
MSFTVLIVDDEDNAREFIGKFLSAKGFEVTGASTLAEARQALQRGTGDIILLDVQLPDGYGPSLLYETTQMQNSPPIILITAYGDIDMAVDAMKNGAHDFLTKPIQLPRLEQSIQRACETVQMRREIAHLRETQLQKVKFIVGQNQTIKVLLGQAQRAAVASVSVLVTGQTGTGKEILAEYIHAVGTRSGKPFIALNCAAIQSTVLESELFGYEPGAFTGADKRKHGLMEVADGGILFLDEISSMPTDIQAKLLRAIEERAFRRVGGTTLIKVDVQIIAASNRNLNNMIKEGTFREDLYYRLKVVDLHLPPLIERKADIPELVGFFIRMNNSKLGMNIQGASNRALEALSAYSWPGNIRELKNTIERAMLFCDEPMIDLPHLPMDIANLPAN